MIPVPSASGYHRMPLNMNVINGKFCRTYDLHGQIGNDNFWRIETLLSVVPKSSCAPQSLEFAVSYDSSISSNDLH